MYRKLLVLVFFFLFLSGCKKNAEIIQSHFVSNEVINTLDGKTEQGLYQINSLGEQLIIYRGIKKGVETMTYSISNNVLNIKIVTEDIDQALDYVYKINSNSSFDTILVTIDGKEEAFITIFVQ